MRAEDLRVEDMSVRADRATVRALLEQFFTASGWRVTGRSAANLEVETGSLRRTVLLGGLAGRRFHQRMRLEMTEDPAVAGDAGGTRIRCRWDGSAGRALGGAVGAARARRLHAATADALAAHLRGLGILREG